MKAKRLGPLFLILFVLIVIGAFAAFYIAQKRALSDEKADLKAYFNITADDETALILDQTILEEKGRLVDNTVYLDLPAAQKYINSRYYYDTQNGLLLYTLPDTTLRAAIGESGYSRGTEMIPCDYIPFRIIDDTPYVALPYLEAFSDIQTAVFTEPNRGQII